MLDPMGREDVMKTILMLNKEMGVTVLHITHNMNEAALADRIVVIDEGKVYLEGTPREVFSNVELMVSLGLEVPGVTELCHLLRKEGIEIPADLLYSPECAEVVEKLYKGGGAQ
jgi:energy-coupling factor transport system ATP-binding protein